MNFFLIENLEHMLQTNWTSFLNAQEMIRTVTDHAHNGEYPTIISDKMPDRHVKVVVTHVKLINEPGVFCELWAEFVVPRNTGVAVGTHVYHLGFDGHVRLSETYGTVLCPKS